MSYVVALFALLFPVLGQAEDALKSPPDLAVGSMIASLLLVIACIVFFAFLMKKSNLIRHGQGKAVIKVIATQSLTNKSRVQIVEVGEKRYLLGVTEQNINLLDILSVPDEEAGNEVVTNIPSNAFASLLSRMSTKRHE